MLLYQKWIKKDVQYLAPAGSLWRKCVIQNILFVTFFGVSVLRGRSQSLGLAASSNFPSTIYVLDVYCSMCRDIMSIFVVPAAQLSSRDLASCWRSLQEESEEGQTTGTKATARHVNGRGRGHSPGSWCPGFGPPGGCANNRLDHGSKV